MAPDSGFLPSLLILCAPHPVCVPPCPACGPPQVIAYYKEKVVHIKADKAQGEVAGQVRRALA